MRIKEKQMEDQLETIHRLKQELAAKEHELQSRKLEWEREQQSLQLLLEQEEASNNELQVHSQFIYIAHRLIRFSAPPPPPPPPPKNLSRLHKRIRGEGGACGCSCMPVLKLMFYCFFRSRSLV